MFKQLLSVLAVAAVCAPVAAAASDESAPETLLTAPGLRLPGSFIGTLPCADCEGISHHLDLWPDRTYHMRRTWLGGDEPLARDEIGRWFADPVDGTIILHGAAEMPLFWDIEGPDEVRMRDISGNRIESSLNYSLTRAEAFDPVELQNLFMSGTFRYMADAASFSECLSGRSYPVAMEGGYLALERAYLEADLPPAAPLYTTIEGGILERPSMEGPPRRHVVVARVGSTDPTGACVTPTVDIPLENTFWRIVSLGDATLTPQPDGQEPYLLLRQAEDETRFAATVGCNRFMGGYTLADDALTLGPAATTMMACPPPLDSYERQLAEVLGAARSHLQDGAALTLLDGQGAVLGVFEAAYYQ